MFTYPGARNNAKSLGAEAAERNGRFPASHWPKRLRAMNLFSGVTAGDILASVDSDEWHHTGAYAAETAYFSLGDIFASRRALRAAIATRRATPKLVGRTIAGCTIEWLEWSGSRRHPRATENKAAAVTVTVKGQWITFAPAPGARPIRKSLRARGLKAIDAAGHIIQED